LDDKAIISLYEARNENAISETERKYGRYLTKVSMNILSDAQYSEECVSDTYLRAWNTIPPEKPNVLRLFLARITRNLSLNKYNSVRAEKRGGTQTETALEELSEVVSGEDGPQERLERKELVAAINAYLLSLGARERGIFVSRYFYLESFRQIAARYSVKEENARLILSRVRKGMKEYLDKEGWQI
jgi:RNA polymerase sigma-70 factor (ECF subfamily)